MTKHIKELNNNTPNYKKKLQHNVQKAVDDRKKIKPKEIFEGYKEKNEKKKKNIKKKY